jgi:hypothetical protein
VHIIRSIPPCAHVHAALPQVLRVSPVKTWCDDGSYKLMNAVESMIHFMEICRVREQVLAEQMWTKYDQNICKFYLSKQGVERCDEVYKERYWYTQINELDSQKRTNWDCYHDLVKTAGHRGGEPRDRSRRWYKATCHKRFGPHALPWYWTMGFIDDTMVMALNRVALRRTEENRQRAHRSGAPEPAVGQKRPRPQATARRDARRFANVEKRWAAAEAPPGPCQAQMCQWRAWPDWSFQERVRCLRCAAFVCLECQPRQPLSGGGSDSALEYFLLCPACFATHSRELPVLGRIEHRPAPDKCDNDEDNTHKPGPFLQCRHCNRWLCADCARDDGPPDACPTLVTSSAYGCAWESGQVHHLRSVCDSIASGINIVRTSS